jgi:dienelactone hydrolase
LAERSPFWHTHHNRLADSFARAGYTVVVPDYFEGDPAPFDLNTPGFDFAAWLARHNASRVDPILAHTIEYMKTQLGVKKVAAAGYCFGGRYVARWLGKDRKGKGGVDVGFMAHPSLMTADEVAGIDGAVGIAAAGMCFFGLQFYLYAELVHD